MGNVNKMPQNWIQTTLGEISLINPKLDLVNLSDDLEISFIPMAAVETESGQVDLTQTRKLGSVKKGYTPFIDGDVIFAKITPCMENGKIAFLSGLKEGIGFGSTEFHVSRPLNNLSRKFIFYFLVQRSYRKDAQGNMTGSAGQLRVPTNFFRDSLIPLPPHREQHRIVAKIEELFSELDKGVEALKTAQQQLKVYHQAVLKWAFEGKLTGKADKHQRYVRLEELCYFITKGTTPLKGNMYQGIGEVPFIKVYNLTFSGKLDFSIDPTFVTNGTHNGFLARSKVLPGDVLMNIVGPPLGKVSIVPDAYPEWNINQAVVRFRCKHQLRNKFLAHFLLANFSIEKMKKKSKATAGQFNLTLEICRDIEIPMISIEEQFQIVQEIETRLSVADKLEETITQSLQQAEALRQSILKKAFEGKLVPQDPNDEPASKLLERIKTVKAAQTPVQKTRKKKANL